MQVGMNAHQGKSDGSGRIKVLDSFYRLAEERRAHCHLPGIVKESKDGMDRYVVGGSHLKMIVSALGGGARIDAIAFNRMPGDLPDGGSVRFLYRLAVNRWQGAEAPQLMVEHIDP